MKILLVYGTTEIPHDAAPPWYRRPWPVAGAVAVVCILLNLLFR